MDGIVLISQDAHLPATIKECVADRTVTDATAFQLQKSRDIRGLSRGSGSQQDCLRFIDAFSPFQPKASIPADMENLVLCKLCSQRFRLSLGILHQLAAGYGLCHAEIIFDFIRLGQRAVILADDQGL